MNNTGAISGLRKRVRNREGVEYDLKEKIRKKSKN